MCLDDQFSEGSKLVFKELPVKNEIYTVRSKRKEPNGKTAYLLEELHNPKIQHILYGNEFIEPSFNIERFTVIN